MVDNAYLLVAADEGEARYQALEAELPSAPSRNQS